MSGTRLKTRPKKRKRISPLNTVLLTLLTILLALVAVMFLWIRSHNDTGVNHTPEEEPNTVYVGGQEVPIDETLPQSQVEEEHFATQEDGTVTYSGEALYGVDVSSHQGEVDWAAVAADGNQFVMLRIGFRGYTAGAIQKDELFDQNYEAARANGLMVGAYFFSQAISEAEAVEEAQQVLSWLDGRELDCPIAYDWEPIENQPDARTNDTDGDTVTACAKAFCETIQASEYRPILYCNGMLGYLSYDLSQLTDYPVWYAEYGEYPSYAYAFEMWQYSESGTVAGIQGKGDRDIWFRSPDGGESEGKEELHGSVGS